MSCSILILEFFVVNLNFACIFARISLVFLLKMRPYFARIFTKMSPYEKLVTLQRCLCPTIEYFGILAPFCYYSLIGVVIDFLSRVGVVKKIPSRGRVASTRHSLLVTMFFNGCQPFVQQCNGNDTSFWSYSKTAIKVLH